MKIEGHAAIVTGGASGLGKETAAQLLHAGARVAVLDLKTSELPGAFYVPCDISSAESASGAIAAAREKHGPARILVNCAGIAPAQRMVGREGPMALDEFARVIQVNLIGTFNLMRLAASEMIRLDPLEDAERGVIVSTASVAAYEGQIGQTAYAASKGGVASLTLPAARELAQFGVRVMAIAPGIFATPLIEGMPQEVQQSLAASVPFPKRLGAPAEFAALVRHCIENRYLNGEVIRLDGATRMTPR